MSIGTEQGEVLIPTVVNGRVVSDEQAIQHYRQTGEHFGIFRTPEEATAYAQQLHQQHERQIGSTASPAAFVDYNSAAYDPLEAAAAQEFGVPVQVLSRLRTRGERSNANQVSEAGARSVYQIIPETRQGIIRQYGFDPWASPQDAARGAAIVARDMYRKFGNWNDAMTGYHGGGDTRNWGTRTRAYAARTRF